VYQEKDFERCRHCGELIIDNGHNCTWEKNYNRSYDDRLREGFEMVGDDDE
jgi:hypothetical protein